MKPFYFLFQFLDCCLQLSDNDRLLNGYFHQFFLGQLAKAFWV